MDGITYPTAEHWMMAGKARLFNDTEMLEKIISAKSPKQVKAFGRQVRNFQPSVWEEKCYEIVLEGNIHKFEQNPELKEFLLGTKDRIIVEASPVDAIWGIGLSQDSDKATKPDLWRGKNLLGFALMETRKRLGGE